MEQILKQHFASRYYGRLLKSIDGVFNDGHQLLPYYTCAFTLYRLEFLFRNKSIPAQYRKFKYFILMLIKYDLADDKIPEMNANKMNKFCEKILAIASDNSKLTDEVNKLTQLIDKHVTDITSAESTKTATLVENLKTEFVIK